MIDPVASESEHALDEAAERAVVSLRKEFAERLISLKTMDKPLRIAVILGFASVLAVVILMGLGDVGGGTVVLSNSGGSTTAVATPVVVVSFLLITIGLAYVYTALNLIASWLSLPLLWVITFLLALGSGALGTLFASFDFLQVYPAWVRWTERGLLVGVLGLSSVGKWIARRVSRGSLSHSFLLLCYAALFGSYFVVFWLGGRHGIRQEVFGVDVWILLAGVYIFMTPMFAAASVDFGDWGELIGSRVVTAIAGRRRDALFALGLVAAAGVAALGYAELRSGGGWLAGNTLLRAVMSVLSVAAALALVAAAFVALRLHHHSWPRKVSISTVIVLSGAMFAAIPSLASWIVGPTPQVASATGHFVDHAAVNRVTVGSGPTAWTFQVPANWQVNSVPSQGLVSASYTEPHVGAEIADFLQLGKVTTSAAIARRFNATSGPPSRVGRWERSTLGGNGLSGYIWVTRVSFGGVGITYVLLEDVDGNLTLVQARPVFLAIASTFRGPFEHPAALPHGSAAPSASQTDRTTAVELGLDLGLLFLLAGAAISTGRWRRQFVVAALLVGVISLLTFLESGSALGHVLFAPSTVLPELSVGDLLFSIGAIGLVLVAVVHLLGKGGRALGRQITVGVIGIEGAAAVLRLMAYLYGKALSEPALGVLAAILILADIAWDVSMSGESTNKGSGLLPRATRVLLFFGYMVLLNAALLFDTHAESIVNGKSAPLTTLLVQPDEWTRTALFTVAVPVLFVATLLRMSERVRNQGTAAEVA